MSRNPSESDAPNVRTRQAITESTLAFLRDYARHRIDTADSDANARIPPSLVLDFGSHGLFGPHLPSQFGGLDLELADCLRLIEQVAGIDLTLAAFLVGHYASAMPILRHGSEALKQQWLPLLAQGRQLAAFALTEPGAGSNPRALETVAQSAGPGQWRLQGQKSYIGNAAWAGLLTVFARHRGGEPKGISAFAIPRGRSGIIIGPEARTLGVRAFIQSSLALRDVPVSSADLIGEPGQGLSVAEAGLSLGRLAICAMCQGAMKRCAQLMLRYASRRQIATGLLLHNPVTHERLTAVGSAIAALEALQGLLLSCFADGQPPPQEALLACKVASSELAWQTADTTVQLLGARGYEEANLAPKILRDLRFLRIGEGPSETLLMQLGAAVCAGEPALRSFFHDRLAAGAIYDRLLLAEPRVHAAAAAQLPPMAAQQRTYYHLGQLAMWGCLEAALVVRGSDAMTLHWCRQQSDQALAAATAGVAWPSLPELQQRVAHYAAAIGELDETLGLAGQALDPLLQAEPAPSAPGAPTEAPATPAEVPAHLAATADSPRTLLVDFPVDSSFRALGAPVRGESELVLAGSELLSLGQLAGTMKGGVELLLLAGFVAFLRRFSQTDSIELLHQASEGTVYDWRIPLPGTMSFRAVAELLGAASGRRRLAVASPAQAVRAQLSERAQAGHSVVPRLVSGGIRCCFVWAAEGPVPADDDYSGVDLTLVVWRQDDRLRVAVRYDSLLFSPETIERRLRNYHELLRAALAAPDSEVAALKLLPDAEWHQVVHGWNGPTTDDAYWQHAVHGLIEAQVDKTPDAIAIQTPAESLTYHVLEGRANQLAFCLHQRGLGRGAIVAIATGRTSALVVAALGVLKAGAAFLPLNCNHPRERLQWMLQETKAALVLVEPETAAAFAELDLPLVCLTGAESATSALPAQRLQLAIDHTAPAYVIFTSGSTGRPKGTVVPHGSLSNEFLWRRDAFGLDSSDRALQTAAPNFDICIWEILGPLSYGGRIVLDGGTGFIWDAAEIIRLINEYEISTIQIVPSQLAVLLGQMKGDDGRSIRLVVCGGEPLPRSLQLRFFETAARGLHNFYGPTEATIEATVWRCQKDDSASTAPIGFATTNRRVYVLDEKLQPVPIGVSGELYIAGVGLALGYLNQPELTAQRFLPDPFAAGGRMYRSGDRVCYRADGALVFQGRVDRQLKVRGVRIEPGEIEATLSSQPDIAQCAVDLQEAAPGDKRLVCYVTPRAGRQPSIASVREYAQQRLPRELVPSAFVLLDALPRTATGKLDLMHLPRVDWRTAASASSGAVTPPTNDVEQAVARLYRDLLRREIADIGVDFFEAGGHSLLAVQALSRIRERWGIDITLREIFAAPTVQALAERIQRALRKSGADALPTLTVVARQGALPLLPSQERLFFMQKLAPACGVYNVPAAVRLTGPLSITHLTAALNELALRHEALRTRFTIEEGRPVQRVVASSTLPLTLIETCGEQLPAQLTEAASQPFDLETDSPLRATVFRLAPQEHVLLWVFHHIAADGWSAGGIFGRELSHLYAACAEGRPLSTPAPAFQLIDYAAWQAQRLTAAATERLRSYWQQAISGASTQLQLPLDRTRPATPSFAGGRVYFALDAVEVRQLRELAKREQVTLYAVLLSAFEVLLGAYSGQTHFLVGSAVAGRYHPDIEQVIGNFVSTVALHADLSGDPTVLELCQRAHQGMLGAIEHGELPFEHLVSELRPERALGINPLFQVAFTLYNGAVHELRLPGLVAQPISLDPGTARFDLTLSLIDDGDTLGGHFEYSADLFHRTTIERLREHFQNLLRAFVMRPEQRAAGLEFLGAAERRRLLVEWQGPAYTGPTPVPCVHALFEEQAAKHPENTAVRFRQESLTYRELNERANQLAHFLCQADVGPETLVGLCVERSPAMLVGILGILKAGGAYVPLDPRYPRERLAYSLADSQVRLVVSDSHAVAALPEVPELRVIRLDADWAAISREPAVNPAHLGTAENLCYVIYTSGSTGRPKGVLVEHRGVSVVVQWSHEALSAEELRGTLAASSLCFDASALELFVALGRGGTLIVVDNILELRDLPADAGVTACFMVPSALAELMRQQVLPASLRTLMCGGEYLSPALVKSLYDTGTVKRVLNVYGPTETTIISTWTPCERGEATTIGRPLPGSEVYLLDKSGRQVPPGATGEIYIGGMGVARGYLGRTALTEERFIRRPFSTQPGARLYKTGDLGRHLPDGRIEYQGRIDHQVKLRGFRIELGEIESTLSTHPEVREAVVLLREEPSGDKRLVAYVLTSDATVQLAELRSFLKTKLPEHMVPHAIVRLDALPMLPNGKTDRHRLRELDVPDAMTIAAPRDGYELALLQIWQELLGHSIPSIETPFFEAGGHSLLAIQLLWRIEREFGRKLPISVLYENGSIAGLAAHLRRGDSASAPSLLLPLKKVAGTWPLFLIHPVSGLSVCYHQLAQTLSRSVFGVQAAALLGGEPGNHAPLSLPGLASEYLRAIRTVQAEGPYLLGGWSLGGVIAFEMAQQLAASGEHGSTVLMFDSLIPSQAVRGLDAAGVLGLFLRELSQRFDKTSQLDIEQLAAMPPERRLDAVLAEAKRLGGLPQDADSTLLSRMLDFCESVTAAYKAYQPRPTSAHVVLFRAEDQRHYQQLLIDPRQGLPFDLGWGPLALDGVHTHAASGEHMTLIFGAHALALGAQIEASLKGIRS